MATTDDSIHVLYVDPVSESVDAIATRLEREDDRLTVRAVGSVDGGARFNIAGVEPVTD
jgi:hypothetical protein